MLATRTQQQKTLIKFQASKDGILAWDEFVEEYDFGGSRELRIEQLEALAYKPYSSKETGGIVKYIDTFEVIVQELESIAPLDYSDSRKKRLLLANIREAAGVAHLIQKCRDNEYMKYAACAAYLRKNAILIDHANQFKAPSRLMHVEQNTHDTPEDQPKTLDQVSPLFHAMAIEDGLETAYNVFNTRTFRDQLSIPTAIWKELEPEIKEKINEI